MGPAPVVRTHLGISMLLRVPFGCSFVLERPVLIASVGSAPAGGCSGARFNSIFVCCCLESLRRANPAVECHRGPDLAAVLF